MQEAPRFPDKLWNVRQAADYLNTTAHGVYKLVERRAIPHIRLGRRLLFDPIAIRTWIENYSISPRPNPATKN